MEPIQPIFSVRECREGYSNSLLLSTQHKQMPPDSMVSTITAPLPPPPTEDATTTTSVSQLQSGSSLPWCLMSSFALQHCLLVSPQIQQRLQMDSQPPSVRRSTPTSPTSEPLCINSQQTPFHSSPRSHKKCFATSNSVVLYSAMQQHDNNNNTTIGKQQEQLANIMPSVSTDNTLFDAARYQLLSDHNSNELVVSSVPITPTTAAMAKVDDALSFHALLLSPPCSPRYLPESGLITSSPRSPSVPAPSHVVVGRGLSFTSISTAPVAVEFTPDTLSSTIAHASVVIPPVLELPPPTAALTRRHLCSSSPSLPPTGRFVDARRPRSCIGSSHPNDNSMGPVHASSRRRSSPAILPSCRETIRHDNREQKYVEAPAVISRHRGGSCNRLKTRGEQQHENNNNNNGEIISAVTINLRHLFHQAQQWTSCIPLLITIFTLLLLAIPLFLSLTVLLVAAIPLICCLPAIVAAALLFPYLVPDKVHSVLVPLYECIQTRLSLPIPAHITQKECFRRVNVATPSSALRTPSPFAYLTGSLIILISPICALSCVPLLVVLLVVISPCIVFLVPLSLFACMPPLLIINCFLAFLLLVHYGYPHLHRMSPYLYSRLRPIASTIQQLLPPM
eukprot:GHVS01002523.1.p1 GENE.GHVS01002523.1~~GHVS01002523.1.p1  ORF type:complete len:621 (+),score=85.02 GHVS01002523.1:54-1916(+)